MVSVLIVTWNSTPHLRECFDSIVRQDFHDLEVVIVDNASSDGTVDLLRSCDPAWRIVYNASNRGFAAGQNQAIAAARGEWLLCLNPDVVLAPDFVRKLVEAGSEFSEAGSLTGKLLRWLPESPSPRTKILDSTGIYFTRNLRHLDRGAEEMDGGQFDSMQWVFGATGAAALFRRSFVDAVSMERQFFDEEFFSYREDADLAWRGQLMGWQCLYVPDAVAWHVRRVTPERRRELPHAINWHSVKNRFLMRGKNASGWLCRRLFWPVLLRDTMVVAYACLRDWSMISAVIYPLRHFSSLRRKRALVQARRRVSDRQLLHWFSDSPQAIPALTATCPGGSATSGRGAAVEERP